MDISFKADSGKFNYRVCAMILSNNRILDMRDEWSPYFYFPGGRVHVGETKEAIFDLSETFTIRTEVE
jgi:hypothetical protein